MPGHGDDHALDGGAVAQLPQDFTGPVGRLLPVEGPQAEQFETVRQLLTQRSGNIAQVPPVLDAVPVQPLPDLTRAPGRLPERPDGLGQFRRE